MGGLMTTSNDMGFSHFSGSGSFQKVLIAIPLVTSLFAGTGTGGYLSQSSISNYVGSNSTFFIRGKKEEISFVHKIHDIKNFFGLNTTEISKIFHVGRPTIYSWIRDGIAPRKDNLIRVNSIYQLLSEFEGYNVSNISEIKNRFHSEDGKNLVDLLEEEKLNFDKISILMNQIEGFAKSYEHNKIKVSHLNELPEDLRESNLEYLM